MAEKEVDAQQPSDVKTKLRVRGEPVPFIMYCDSCNSSSFFPEDKIDFDDPPEGWKCCYCGQKYKMKFRKSLHKWEYTKFGEPDKKVGVDTNENN